MAKKLSGESCPSCSGPLEHGFIFGGGPVMRWVKNRLESSYLFAGEPLVSPSMFQTPVLEAYRCTSCGIGIFSYNIGATDEIG